MDVTIERIADKTTKKKFRQAFLALQLPSYVIVLTAFVFCIVLGTILSFPGACLFFYLSAILLIKMLTWWPRLWRICNQLLKKQHAFETPTRIHFSDSFLEISCGENYSKKEYSFFSHYFCQKKQIVLLFQKNIQGVYDKNKFEDDGEEWIRCLEAHGVKKLHFWSLRRWALPIVVFLLFIMAGTLLWGSRNQSKLDENGNDYARQITCINNLKQQMVAVHLYALDYDGHLPPRENWQNALQKELGDSRNLFVCPAAPPDTVSYVYLGDDWMTLPDEETAQRLPLFHESQCFHSSARKLIYAAFMDGRTQGLSSDELADALRQLESWIAREKKKKQE